MDATKIDLDLLEITSTNSTSLDPLYLQVYTDLKRILRSGRFNPGDMLPPEIDLAQAYGVGRQTIREAIARLVDERLLERFAGRGTFIKALPDRTKFYLDRSFTQQLVDMGMAPGSEVLSVYTGNIDENAPKALHSQLGSPCLHLTRLRLGNSDPIGIQYSVILTRLCPHLDLHDFNITSLYQVLSTEYHLQISEISHVVTAVRATELFTGLLRTAAGTPLLQVNTVAYLEGGEPIEATTSYYRSDRYEFSVVHSYHDCN
jgi:GntR family transcriptional regulator